MRSGKADSEAEVVIRVRQCVDGTEPSRRTSGRWRAPVRRLVEGLKPMTVCCDRGWGEPSWPIDPVSGTACLAAIMRPHALGQSRGASAWPAYGGHMRVDLAVD